MGESTIRRVRFDRYGGVDELYVDEQSIPTPADREVVVRVLAAGINPGEAAVRSGALAEQLPSDFPSGQGSDFAGLVHEIGAGVDGLAVGQEVLGWSDQRSSHADFVVTEYDHIVAKPLALDWIRAGSLFVAGTTAWAAVDAVAPRPQETVVVSGAAGGVGSLAIQLARQRGARVLGIASAANTDFVESLGVEHVTYGDGLAQRLRDVTPDGIDAVVDTHGDGYVDMAIELGVNADRIDTIIDFAAAERHGVKTAANAQGASSAVLDELAELVAWGDLVLPIAAIYPLVDVRAAFDRLAAGHTRGKIVLSTQAQKPSWSARS